MFFNDCTELLDKIINTQEINKTIVLQTLQSIIQNIIENPNNEKFKKIQLKNEKFQKRILEESFEAYKLLETLGFKRKDEEFVCEYTKEDQFKLILDEINKRVFKHFKLNFS